ncbi:MAG: Tm-1-like ATP-binding domain-containing protein, partial [Planctomycetia bacterium]
MSTRFVYIPATMDTKGREAAYVAERLRAAGVAVRTVDVGSGDAPAAPADVPRETLAALLPAATAAELASGDRGRCVAAMGVALAAYIETEHAAGRVAGVLGLGGSGGSTLAAAAFRVLPVGLPKLLVSTVASGDVSPYVGCTDVTIMYAVVDVAGVNRVSRRVLGNAAHAMAGMVQHETPAGADKPLVALTMFGVT